MGQALRLDGQFDQRRGGSPAPAFPTLRGSLQLVCVATYGRERASKLRVAAVEPLIAILSTCHSPLDNERFEVQALYRRCVRGETCAMPMTLPRAGSNSIPFLVR